MTAFGLNEQHLQKMQTHPGFIAALDQSGGSTPNALRLYGIKQATGVGNAYHLKQLEDSRGSMSRQRQGPPWAVGRRRRPCGMIRVSSSISQRWPVWL